MKDQKIKKLVLSSIFAAIVCAATAVVSFPLPGRGFANLGDCFVIICGGLIGSWWGFASAAIGSALSDIILGYAVYAPVTFIIKGLMALAVYYIAAKNGKTSVLKTALSAVAAEIIMIAGYFLFELAVFGAGVAIPDLVGNGMQAVVGAVTGTVLLSVFLKNKKLYSFFE
ncbi:MAG: ECF transporter S component [Oscillospiraceae bacterium]|nr:ECF transporter S component [Oscillospiraceae bacterium]